VDVEVYYHPTHAENVPRMANSIKKSLAYHGAHFGPYRHKQARIIEFPRYQTFAQAFPGTMPYSEAIGFIADLSDTADIDMVFLIKPRPSQYGQGSNCDMRMLSAARWRVISMRPSCEMGRTWVRALSRLSRWRMSW
jgi:hypothetical protein